MIIISQWKDEILNFNNIVNIQVTKCCDGDDYLISAGLISGRDDNYRDLGYYKTEERAKEILQEIVNEYKKYLVVMGGTDVSNIPKAYIMPKE